MAWLLDNIADDDGAVIEQLTAAIRDAQRGTDLRTAVESADVEARVLSSIAAERRRPVAQPP